LRRTATSAVDGLDVAPFVAASLAGALLVGALSSVLDASRTAFLLFFLLALALMLRQPRGDGSRG